MGRSLGAAAGRAVWPLVICWSALFLGGLAACPGAVAFPQIHLDERESFHNASFLRQRDEIDALLFDAKGARAAGKLGEAVRLYRQVLASGPDALVALGERTLVRADRLVAQRLQEMGPEALAIYRNGVAEAAEAALAKALRSGSLRGLLRVARLYPLTPQEAGAWQAYGERSFEEGRFGAACFALAMAEGSPAADPQTRALARTRLRIARAARGLAPLSSPDVSGSLPEGVPVGGSSMAEAAWRGLLGAARARFARDPWPALLGDNARLGALERSEPLSFELIGAGRVPLRGLEEADKEARAADSWREPARTGRRGYPPAPVLARGSETQGRGTAGLGIVPSSGTLRFVDLATGREVFGPLRFDFDLHIDPRVNRVDPESVAIAVDGHLAYLCLNLVERGNPKTPALGCLYALDLDQEAKPLWRFEALRQGDAEPEDAGGGKVRETTDEGDAAGALLVDPRCAMAGPPLIVDGRVYVTASRLRDALTECYLVGLDGQSGEDESWTFLCSASEVARFADRFATLTPGRVDASPPAEADGLVYVLTNLGVVVAVAACSGEIEWAFRYNRIFAVDSTMYNREALYDTGGWPRTPVVVDSERLYVAPADSRYFYVLARRPSPRGYLILDDPIEKAHKVHFLGVAGERLLFEVKRSSGRLVEGTDRAGGTLFETPPLELEEILSGWPIQVGRELLVPTNKNLYRVRLDQDGRMADYLTPPEAMGSLSLSEAAFGCLAAGPGYLLSVSRDWYAVYRLMP